MTNQCHDITVFPEIGLAAGACAGNGILLDISDPVNPVRLDHVVDKNFAYWHSATFNNDGTKVIFTDEWGGGTRPRCRATDLPTWGANAIFDIVDRKMRFGGYYKLPAPQTEQENCVAHNGSLIPVPGRDIMVQAWYQGGVSVFDFTDSANPVEIAFFDRGPIDAKQLITRRLLVGLLVQRAHLRRGDRARARRVQADAERVSVAERDRRRDAGPVNEFNAQQQPKIAWPATLGRGAGLPRSARPGTRHPTGPRVSRRRSARPRRQAPGRPDRSDRGGRSTGQAGGGTGERCRCGGWTQCRAADVARRHAEGPHREPPVSSNVSCC